MPSHAPGWPTVRACPVESTSMFAPPWAWTFEPNPLWMPVWSPGRRTASRPRARTPPRGRPSCAPASVACAQSSIAFAASRGFASSSASPWSQACALPPGLPSQSSSPHGRRSAVADVKDIDGAGIHVRVAVIAVTRGRRPAVVILVCVRVRDRARARGMRPSVGEWIPAAAEGATAAAVTQCRRGAGLGRVAGRSPRPRDLLRRRSRSRSSHSSRRSRGRSRRGSSHERGSSSSFLRAAPGRSMTDMCHRHGTGELRRRLASVCDDNHFEDLAPTSARGAATRPRSATGRSAALTRCLQRVGAAGTARLRAYYPLRSMQRHPPVGFVRPTGNRHPTSIVHRHAAVRPRIRRTSASSSGTRSAVQAESATGHKRNARPRSQATPLRRSSRPPRR